MTPGYNYYSGARRKTELISRVPVVAHQQIDSGTRQSFTRSELFPVVHNGDVIPEQGADQRYCLPNMSGAEDQQLELRSDDLDCEPHATSLFVDRINQVCRRALRRCAFHRGEDSISKFEIIERRN